MHCAHKCPTDGRRSVDVSQVALRASSLDEMGGVVLGHPAVLDGDFDRARWTSLPCTACHKCRSKRPLEPLPNFSTGSRQAISSWSRDHAVVRIAEWPRRSGFQFRLCSRTHLRTGRRRTASSCRHHRRGRAVPVGGTGDARARPAMMMSVSLSSGRMNDLWATGGRWGTGC